MTLRLRLPSGPLAEVHLATLVLAVGSGAWFTCWAIFFTRSVGLTATEFGVGVTVAGLLALVLGSPLGYLADRVGTREVLVCLGLLQGLATLCYLMVSGFWLFLAVSVVAVTVQRVAPGIRVAVISGLTAGPDRLRSISANRVILNIGLTAGSALGALVLALDNRAAYVALVMTYSAANLAAGALTLRVAHVPSLADQEVKRGMRVLRDRPFLVITLLSGVLALNWGVLDTGLPLWINAHTHAPLGTIGIIVAGNAVAVVCFQNRLSRMAEKVASAARVAVYSGAALAAACLLFALTYHRGGLIVIALLLLAAAVLTFGELLYFASAWGLSVGLTSGDAHGEYQSTFATGPATALSFAPVLMTTLVVGWGVLGWLVLAVVFLAGSLPTVPVSRWAVRTRAQLETVS
ncbi:MAG: MFS transporter [Streptosporangiaceae bacterium]